VNNSRRRSAAGAATLVASGTSNQFGAAIGAHAFGAIGPIGVVAIRQIVAALVLIPVARPPLRRLRWAEWWPVLALGSVFVVMNFSLYAAVDRIGLGLAVTLEFLGPLAVALAASRTRVDLAGAVGAGVGVYVLVLPGPSSDVLGLALSLAAAACWASYILLNRHIGTRLPGLQGPAVASLVATVLTVPVLVWLAAEGRLTAPAVALAAVAGVLSSAVPYTVDLVILRHVAPGLFGVIMSMQPALAALAGLVVLGQRLEGHELVGIAIVAAVNAVAARSHAVAPDLDSGSVLALDDEVGAADHPGQLRLLPRELEARREFLGHVHAVGQLEPDRSLGPGLEPVHDVDRQAGLVEHVGHA
jgi:inner membrane transporter RhtA